MTSFSPPVYPLFLCPLESSEAPPETRQYNNAIIHHSSLASDAHALWWAPAVAGDKRPDEVILFVPGNPGLLGFYLEFLSELHAKAQAIGQATAILAQAHIGHTPALGQASRTRLEDQVTSAIEALDLLHTYFGPRTKYVLIGHSVGAWICTQVIKARPEVVHQALMVTPTISNIVTTPNGRRLYWAFKEPVPWLAATGSYLLRLVPTPVLARLFSDWPPAQLAVLQALLGAPPVIRAALTMAADEMRTITAVDLELLRTHQAKLRFYFVNSDDWVGAEREVVLSSFEDVAAVKVYHGSAGIPHAFCINHGKEVAQTCFEWLSENW